MKKVSKRDKIGASAIGSYPDRVAPSQPLSKQQEVPRMIPDSSPESVFSRVYNNMRFERRRIPDMPFLESYFINGGEVVGSVFASELAKSYRDEAIANSPYRIVATPNTPIHAPAVRMYRVVSESERQPDWEIVRKLNTATGATEHHTVYDGSWTRIGGDWTMLFPKYLRESQVQP